MGKLFLILLFINPCGCYLWANASNKNFSGNSYNYLEKAAKKEDLITPPMTEDLPEPCSYIGLADDEISSFWKGMITHDHFDGQKQWGYANDDRTSALKRIARLKGKPVLVCGKHAEYLKNYRSLADFTFLPVPVSEIFHIPEGKVIHPHTDMWAHRESTTRQRARDWLLRKAGLN